MVVTGNAIITIIISSMQCEWRDGQCAISNLHKMWQQQWKTMIN